MPRLLIAIVLCGVALASPASAGAQAVKITVPPSPPSEDVAFAVSVTGSAGTGSGLRAVAKARPVAGLQCAALPGADSGSRVLDEQVAGNPFSVTGTYTAADAGDHLVCAWLVDAGGHVVAGPVSQLVTVREPVQRVDIFSLRHVRVGFEIGVTVDYSLEAARRLVVVVARGATCAPSPAELLRTQGTYQEIADLHQVADGGVMTVSGSADHWGVFVVCAYLFPLNASDDVPAELVVTGNPIRAGSPARRCADAGGPRRITDVRVGGFSCARARSVARRWGAARHPPGNVSGFDCRRLSGRRVICTYGVNTVIYGEVRFRYRR